MTTPADRQLLVLAAVLVAAGVDLVVVGSCARWMAGEGVHPRDLDVVVRDTASNRRALARVLDTFAVGPRPRVSPRGGLLQCTTSFGLLDIVLGAREVPATRTIRTIAGVAVPFSV